jgi:hypothetical protein
MPQPVRLSVSQKMLDYIRNLGMPDRVISSDIQDQMLDKQLMQ